MKKTRLVFEAKEENVPLIRHAVNSLTKNLNLEYQKIYSIQLIVCEACTNVVKYAYPSFKKNKYIYLNFNPKDKKLLIFIRDKGNGIKPQGPADNNAHWGLKIIEYLADNLSIKSSSWGTRLKIEILLPQATHKKAVEFQEINEGSVVLATSAFKT